MTDKLIIAGLSASLGLAVLSWICGGLVDRSGAGPRLRLGVWTVAFLSPVALPLAMVAIAALDIASPFALSPAAAAPPVPMDMPASSVPVFAPVAAYTVPTPPLAEQPQGGPSYALWILGLVLAGAAIQLLRLFARLRALSRVVSASVPLEDGACARRLGLAAGRVRVGDSPAPLLAGVLRPVIVLPRSLAQALSVQQLDLICAHEVAHLKRGDHLHILAEEVLLALHWFNPVLRVIRSRLSLSREEVCDARVLSCAPEDTRRAYARTLLAAMEIGGGGHPVAAFTGTKTRPVTDRLRAILRPPPHRPAAMVAGVCAGAFLAGAASVTALAFAGQPLTVAGREEAASVMQAVQSTPSRSQAGLPAVLVESQNSEVAVGGRLQLAMVNAPASSVSAPDPASLDNATKALAEARLKRLELEALRDRLRSAPNEKWPEITGNTELRALYGSIQDVDKKQTGLVSNMSARSPEVAGALAKVFDQRREMTAAQIIRVTASIEASLALDIRMATAQEAALQQEVRRLES